MSKSPSKRAPKRAKKVAAAEGEATPVEHAPRTLPDALKANVWTPGQSGNPNGRPKGSRNKLSEAFVTALFEDFESATETAGVSAGKEAIAKVRTDEPGTYLKVIAALAPKQVHIKEDVLDAFDDDELSAAMAAIAAIRQTRSTGSEDRGEASAAPQPKPH